MRTDIKTISDDGRLKKAEQTQMAPHFASVSCIEKVDIFENYFRT